MISKSILPLIQQRLVSAHGYLWSLFLGGACIWELSQSDLIAMSCLKRVSGISLHPALSLALFITFPEHIRFISSDNPSAF